MSTIKAIGGTLSQFGKKLALGPSSSNANVEAPNVEVNVPPIWEEANNTTGNVGDFISSPFDGDFLVYRPYRIGNYGTYSVDEADIGDTFKLSERTFISASDRNTGAELTLTLISQSIVSGAGGNYNTQEITLDDINIIFPDNTTPGNTASFFIETSSNFEIHEDISYEFEIQVKDQHGYISRVNKPSDSNHNSQHNIFNKISINNTKESPFIITQSNSVSISSSTTPSDNISEMEFSLGNESSPDFTLIPTIYIKDRDRIDIINIKNNGDGPTAQTFYDFNFPSYITTTSTGGDNLIFSSSHLVANNETASARYFHLDLDPDQLPTKLSAKNSPYKLEISASDGTSAKTSSSILLNITNENPVWVDNNTIIVKYQGINSDTKRFGIRTLYPSASDPGGDNISISTISRIMSTANINGRPNVGLIGSDFDVVHVQGTDTGSFYIVTSSTFPEDLGTSLKGNARLDATVRASDECSPAGTKNITTTFMVDAPPSWSAEFKGYATNEKNVGSSLDAASYATVFDDTTHIGTSDSGDTTLYTGSGFDITCNDPRLQDSWFTFTPTNAVNGGNATYTVATSSNFNRIDANALIKLYVTASDNNNQTSQHEFRLTITNIDDLPDVLGDLYDDLRSFITPRVNGVTTQLENDVLIESVIDNSNTEINSVSGSVAAHIIGNGGSALNVTSINQDLKALLTDDTSQSDILYYDNLLLNTSAGSVSFWIKHDGANNAGACTFFGNNNFGFAADGTTNVGIPRIGGAALNTIAKYFLANGPYTGDWHMITFAWTSANAGTWYVWLNDNLVVNGATTNSNLTNDFKASFIGAKGFAGFTPSEYQPVSMSCAISFNKTLNSSEVEYIFTRFSGSHGL
jgi:hypothetical protein